mmetsp:Transcript_29137/g.76325  ORF Transcript_29137/g.76325 Transcript_29137/m.76325 type:complete len:248 (+) Transcript_29137:373-1116(+)
MDQVADVHVDHPCAYALREFEDLQHRELSVPPKLVGLVDQVKQRTIHELGHDEVLSRGCVGAHTDERADVGMVQRGHDARFLEELRQPDVPLSLHLLHRHQMGPVCRHGAAGSVHRRGEDAAVHGAVATLRNLRHQRELLQRQDEPPEHRVAQDVPRLVPAHAVLPAVHAQQPPQGLPHDQPLHGRREAELAPQLRVGHLQQVLRPLDLPLLHARGHLWADAEARHEGGELVLAPQQGGPQHLPRPP